METGDISVKTQRGKHTTRHAELLPLGENTYVMDTPGFTSLDIFGADRLTLKDYYNEFSLDTPCRFADCVHVNEPDCAVKEAVLMGKISKLRYDNYLELFSQLNTKRQ